MTLWVLTYGVIAIMTAFVWGKYEAAHTLENDKTHKYYREVLRGQYDKAQTAERIGNEYSDRWHTMKPLLVALIPASVILGNNLPRIALGSHVVLCVMFHAIWWVLFNPVIAKSRGAKWDHLSDKGVDKVLKDISQWSGIHHIWWQLMYLNLVILIVYK